MILETWWTSQHTKNSERFELSRHLFKGASYDCRARSLCNWEKTFANFTFNECKLDVKNALCLRPESHEQVFLNFLRKKILYLSHVKVFFLQSCLQQDFYFLHQEILRKKIWNLSHVQTQQFCSNIAHLNHTIKFLAQVYCARYCWVFHTRTVFFQLDSCSNNLAGFFEQEREISFTRTNSAILLQVFSIASLLSIVKSKICSANKLRLQRRMIQ